MSKLPSIPDFVETLDGVSTTLRAVKGAVEIIGGQRHGQSLGAPSMFVQEEAPQNARQALVSLGDLWIRPSTRVMSFWDGREWTPLA